MNVRLKRRVILFAVAVMAAVSTATGVDLYMDYQRAKAQTEKTARDITLVVEKHIYDTAGQVETLLRDVAATIVADGSATRMRQPDRIGKMATYCKSITGCAFIGVIDPAGHAVAITGFADQPELDVSDRGFFRQSVSTGRLYIDKAIVTRLPGRPIVFNISLPVRGKDGALLGVVAVGMHTEHFTSFYQLMGFTLDPTITVFKGNGDLVARNPGMHENVGKNNANGPLFKEHLPKAPEGIYESVSVLDGKVRLAAYKSLPDLDIVVFAGIEKTVAFTAWQERAQVTIVLVALLAVLLTAMIAYTYRSLLSQLHLLSRNRQLDHMAQTDGLTGIPNRRKFDDTLERDWARHGRTGQPLSVLMIDIDHFKQFNDGYGHQAGDACLRAVARALESCLHRKVDVVARYGGEEFAAALDCDEQGAVTVATRMRLAVESLAIPNAYSGTSCYVTVSIGVASTSSIVASGSSDLLLHADRGLYEAKVQGRNRVIAAPAPGARLKLVSTAAEAG